MKLRGGLSIGKRLGLGFGILLVLLALLLAATVTAHSRLGSIQRRQDQVVLPRASAAEELQRACLGLGIAARNVFLTGKREDIDLYRGSISASREALEALRTLPKEADGQRLFAEIPELADRYWTAAGEFAALRTPESKVDASLVEDRMSAARASLLARVEQFQRLQHQKLVNGAKNIARTRNELLAGTLGMGALMLLAGGLTAWRTAHSVRRPIATLVDATRAVARGDYGPAIQLGRPPEGSPPPARSGDELTELARAFGRTAAALLAREHRLLADVRLGSAVAASLEPESIAREALRTAIEHTGCEVGAVYLVEPSEAGSARLRRIASHALEATAEIFALGEGIPGEAARSRRTLVVADVPADTPFKVLLGVDRLPPRTVVAAPVVFRDQCLGVLLLAGLRSVNDEMREFIEHAASGLGLGLRNAVAHLELARLAAELEERHQRLAAQAEEIQAQNEELQAQTEEIQAQNEEIRSHNEQLRALTIEIRQQNLALQAANQRLAELDRQKDHFMAMLGHELRNPLGALSNAVQIFRQLAPSRDDRLANLGEVMERQVRQQARLLDDLLDTSRMARGKMTLQKEPVDLARVVREALEDHRPRLEHGGRMIHAEIPESQVVVKGDAARLTQMVCNLLDNAEKFTRPGDQIGVRLNPQREEGRVLLEVRDTGMGIAPALLPRIFEAFTQADSGLDRGRGGLGLGLALAKGVVELHGGSITASSQGENRGAILSILLPLAAASITTRRAPPTTIGATSRRRIVIIEDQPDVAASLRDILRLGGHEVAVALTGDEGITLVRQVRPEVVLCDLGLPDKDGYAVARELRGDGPGGFLLVALTGYGDDEHRRRSAEAGFDLHLIKPVAISRLNDLLAERPSETAKAE